MEKLKSGAVHLSCFKLYDDRTYCLAGTAYVLARTRFVTTRS
jgi:hypothetical protein